MRIVLSAIWHVGLWGMAAGAILGIIYGWMLADPFVALMLGPASGGIIGGALGMLEGMVIGVVTRALFRPPFDPLYYRAAVLLVSVPFSGIGAGMGFRALAELNVADSVRLTDSSIPIILIPAVVATVAGGWAAWRCADRYTAAGGKKKKRGELGDA